MSRGSRIEQDVVEIGGRARIALEPRKLVEGRNLHGAGAGKLFFHAGDGCIRQYAPVRPHEAFALVTGCRLGIDVQGPQAGNFGNRCGPAAQ